MNFERACNILAEEGTRSEFFVRLKQAGESSPESEFLQKIMNSLGMMGTPKHVFNTTFLQHTFQYCEPLECFTNLRNVCKAWRLAVDTKKRFDHLDKNTMRMIYTQTKYENSGVFDFGKDTGYQKPIVMSKTIKSLTQIQLFCGFGHSNYSFYPRMLNILSKNACNLKSFEYFDLDHLPENYSECLINLYRNSHKTLEKLEIPVFYFASSNLQFLNLTIVDACYSNYDIPYNFLNHLENLVSCAPNLKVIKIDLHPVEPEIEIFETLRSKYPEQFVKYSMFDRPELLNYLPIKIIHYTTLPLTDVASLTYAHKVQYLEADVSFWDENTNKWTDDYKKILQEFSGLKGVYIHDSEGCGWGGDDSYETYEESIEYMKSIGIEVVDGYYGSWHQPTIKSWEEKVYKNIPWGFEFYYGAS